MWKPIGFDANEEDDGTGDKEIHIKNQMRKNYDKNLSGKATTCLGHHHHSYTRD